MFIEFQVENFRSFRDLTTLTMRAFPKRTNDKGADEGNVYESMGQRMLKSKAIFGANASGKSNLVKALRAFVTMVARSVERENLPKEIWEDRFGLATEWDSQAVFFQGLFMIGDSFYRYGFQILKGVVSHEWMFVRKESEDEETELLMRSPERRIKVDSSFKGARAFAKQAENGGHELFRADSLFLTGAALNGIKLATALRAEIRKIIIIDGINDAGSVQVSMEALETDAALKTFIKNFIAAADTGINDIRIVDLPESALDGRIPKEIQAQLGMKSGQARSLHSVHTQYDDNGKPSEKITVPFEDWESEGTGKLFGFSAPLMISLVTGRAIVIDEFDARLHPNITLKIVELFHSERTNPNHAQLIFVTHDASLLQRAELRRDQVAIADKDKYGVTRLTTLAQYKGIRKDASYEKEYLRGAYRGVGKLGLLESVVEDFLNAELDKNELPASK
jgi:uncharacterized protein